MFLNLVEMDEGLWLGLEDGFRLRLENDFWGFGAGLIGFGARLIGFSVSGFVIGLICFGASGFGSGLIGFGASSQGAGYVKRSQKCLYPKDN
jgi:hypothetical protein